MANKSKYRPEHCRELIDHMAKGFSFESFAGAIGVSKQTIYDWLESHPDFMDAKAIAQEKCRFHWEKLSVEYVINKPNGPTINSQVYTLNMRNRFPQEWGQKQEQPPETKDKTLTEAERALLADLSKRLSDFPGDR